METIRYYEREGLLPAAPRSEGNYRIYSPARDCGILDELARASRQPASMEPAHRRVA